MALQGIGGAGMEGLRWWEEEAGRATRAYLDEFILKHLGALGRYEAAEHVEEPLAEMSQHLRDFSARWEKVVNECHKDTEHLLGPTRGAAVMRALVEQLLLIYTRLLDNIRRAGPEGQELARGAVSIEDVATDLKRIAKY